MEEVMEIEDKCKNCQYYSNNYCISWGRKATKNDEACIDFMYNDEIIEKIENNK